MDVEYTGLRYDGGHVEVLVERKKRATPEDPGTLDECRPLFPRAGGNARFEWGTVSSNTAHLAYAILADYFGVATAELGYHRFTNDVIAKFPAHESWVLTDGELRGWLRGLIDAPSELERVIAEQSPQRGGTR